MGPFFLACLFFCSGPQPNRAVTEQEFQILKAEYDQRLQDYNKRLQDLETEELARSFCEDGILKVKKSAGRHTYKGVVMVGKSIEERNGHTVPCVSKVGSN